MAKKTDIAIYLTMMIFFVIYGLSIGQCLKKKEQHSRCENIANQLSTSLDLIKKAKRCLKRECKRSLSNSTGCEVPTPTADPIDKSLSVEAFFQEMMKRLVIHEIRNHSHIITHHFKTTECYKDVAKQISQIHIMKNWVEVTQKQLGLSTLIQGTKPPKLSSTGAKSQKDWYDIQMQMLQNLMKDFGDMAGYFPKTPGTLQGCIIPVC